MFFGPIVLLLLSLILFRYWRQESVVMEAPSFFLSHGGGPCFFMEAKSEDDVFAKCDKNSKIAQWYRDFAQNFIHEEPKCLVVISAHWEESEIRITSKKSPELLFDYYGFPPHTYELKYPAKGSSEVSQKIMELLSGGGVAAKLDSSRNFDHGVFIPLMLMFPKADIPIVQVSLRNDLDPEFHIRVGELLSPLRKEGVVFVGSGFATHNLRALFENGDTSWVKEWDSWLNKTILSSNSYADMKNQMINWHKAPGARLAHPREEHLIPLHVVVGLSHETVGKGRIPKRLLNDIHGAADWASFEV